MMAAQPETERPTVKCGNRAAHGGEPGYHFTPAGVRECYASTGRFGQTAPAAPPQSRVWHSTGPRAEQGHYEAHCPGQSCPVVQMIAHTGEGPVSYAEFCEHHEFWDGEYSEAQQHAAYARYLAGYKSTPEPMPEPMPEVTVEDAVAKMRANLDAEARRKAEAQRARYAAWRSIPVFGAHHRGYYALEMDGETHFFRVERPAKGKWAGKTFVTEQAGDAYHRMPFERAGQVMDSIAADPATAGRLYGQEIGRCYRCHRTLTDPESRALGIGPDCQKKEG